MVQKKEMAGDYEVLQSIKLGGRTLLLGYNPKDQQAPYMTCYEMTNLLGDRVFPEAIGGADYYEIMQTFMERMQKQMEKVAHFREERSVPFCTLGIEHCRKRGENESLEGKIIILRQSSLAPEYRRSDCQLGYALGGFGCAPRAGGRAVYFRELYSGEECRWDVGDVLGIADPEKLPEWAQEKARQQEAERGKAKKEREEVR